MIPTDRFAEEMKDMMDALIVAKVAMQAQEVPEPRYVWVNPETYEQSQRIIYTDKVNIEDCRMTERTVEQVDKDINAAEKSIEDRSFIIGPSHMKGIVTFDVRADTTPLTDSNFEEWNKQMDGYFRGETPGRVSTRIETVGCEGEVLLDDALLTKIADIRFDIMMKEAREIMHLKRERTKLRDIEEKRHALEMAEKGLEVNKHSHPMPDIMSF